MVQKTITRLYLTEAVYKTAHVSRIQSAALVEAFLRNSHRHYLDLGWLENVSQRLRTSLEIGEDTLAIALFVIGRAGICIVHPMANSIVKEDRDLSSCRCNCFCLSDPCRQAAIKAPNAVSVRPTVVAASLNSAAARFPEGRVRDDRILPPEILLPGANESQDVKCLALGHAERSVPHSLINVSARYGPSP